jgi:hypothetical protein
VCNLSPGASNLYWRGGGWCCAVGEHVIIVLEAKSEECGEASTNGRDLPVTRNLALAFDTVSDSW